MKYFRFFRIGKLSAFGAPVYVHTSVFLVSAIVLLSAVKAPLMALSALLSYLSIIFIHEAGHALVARKLGLYVDRIDISWIHGCCHYQKPDYEWHDVLVSWGGVLAQLAVATPVLLIGATGVLDSWSLFGPVWVFLGYVNLVIAALSALPGPGLDGTMMWRIVPIWLGLKKDERKHEKKRRKPSLTVVPKDE